MRPVVGVLVVNYFGHESVARLCSSLIKHRGEARLHISIVDNSQNDAEFGRLLDAATAVADDEVFVHVEQAIENAGYAGGNNRAWKAIAAEDLDVVLIVNPDAEVIGGDIKEFAHAVSRAPFTLIGAQTLQDGEISSGLSVLERPTARSRSIPVGAEAPAGSLVYPDGHFLAMSAETWRAVGGLSEDYFLYAEELDLTLRLMSLRPEAAVLSLDGVTVRHVGGESTSHNGAKSDLTYLHGTRSRLVLYRSHRSLRPFLPLLLLVRAGWACSLAARGNSAAAKSVFQGLRRGMMDRVNRRGRAWS